jgi:hypothetical protein
MIIPITKKEIAIDDKQNRLLFRDKIDQYEQALKDALGSETGDLDEINSKGLVEYFVGDAYTRQLFIPADTTMVSKLWNKERLWIIATGDVTITTEAGQQRVKGPHVMQPIFGSKVALYTHADTLWFAVTGAKSTDSKSIEEEVVAKDYSEFTYPWDMLEDKGEER